MVEECAGGLCHLRWMLIRGASDVKFLAALCCSWVQGGVRGLRPVSSGMHFVCMSHPFGRFTVKTAVVALGKIGLPLAVQFADAGHEVVGVDVNPRQVELINAGSEPFPGEAHLQEKLSELVPAGRLPATTDYAEAIPGADAVVIVVAAVFVNDMTWEPDFRLHGCGDALVG